MKIITGISNSHTSEEIAAYSDAGVDEFFIGYIPRAWSDEYGWELSINRRETANYQYRERSEIDTIVDLIHQNSKKVYLTINAHEYNVVQTKLLIRSLREISDIKFDGFIVSNIGVLLELQNQGLDLPMNISIGGASNNLETLDFFKNNIKNLGRIILPRKLTLSEIAQIARYANENDIRLEAFGMAAFCVFNDEYCFTWHSGSNKCFCQSPMFENRKLSPLIFENDWKDELENENISDYYKRQLTIQTEIQHEKRSYKPNTFISSKEVESYRQLYVLADLNKCGLCAFDKFNEWGIEAIKLPLRGQGFKNNLDIIKMAKAVIDNPEPTPEKCQEIIGNSIFCNGKNCYYDFPYQN